jgi:hypothetical protein
MFYMFQATTRPPRGHHDVTSSPRGERETGNNVVGSPGGKSRNKHLSRLFLAVPNVARVKSVASPHSFERK